MKHVTSYMKRLIRIFDNKTYRLRRKFSSKRKRTTGARVGVYVAYFDASWVFEDHLRCIRDLTVGTFNYYVMGNCSSLDEQNKFNEIVARFGFVNATRPWPNLLPHGHGQSLQRLIDRTTDEIIVLCDVDAFPIKKGWDEFIIKELEEKDVVAVVVDMPHRAMPVFLHPCFMAFRREFLEKNKLNVFADGGNDPACMISVYLFNSGKMTPEHVTPLYPTLREIELSEPGTNEFFGRSNLIHGFGTTYSDLIFHFWFARYIARKHGVSDSKTNISGAEVEKVVSRVFNRLRENGADTIAR